MKKKSRRHFDAELKALIVKRYLVNKEPISDLCDEYEIGPNQVYAWQKQLFENGSRAFEVKRKPAVDPRDRKIATLEEKLTKKNEVVSELLEEHVQLKKELGDL